jgi:nuclease-like protein
VASNDIAATVETSARSRFKRILPFGWSVDKNPPFVSGVGNIDMVVRTLRHAFVVEIKSWETWDNTERNRLAVVQAKNLLHAIAEHDSRKSRKWQAVIWLPKGKKKQTRHDPDLIVVAGSPVWLFWVLHLVMLKFF